MEHIAVLLTCHNRKSKTLLCLNALSLQKGIEGRYSITTFLVDDGSTDGTSDQVHEIFPNVIIVQGSGHLYWNRGMHLAWNTAASTRKFDYYLWLNDDTILFEDAISELLNCKKMNTGLTIVCGSTCSEIDNSFTYGLSTISGKKIEPNDISNKGSLMNGNCVLISDQVFNLIGNLDPLYPHAIGDHDYGMRLIKKGGYILTTTKFIGTCEKNKSLPLWCYSTTPILLRLRNLYSPLANSNPYYFFIYEQRHFGYLKAIKHYISIHLRAFIPSLWN